jgi:hypothetical protein
VPWGDPIVSVDDVLVTGIFRLVSHNVNGLSSANNHVDVVHMANAMADKEVALFGLQETNRISNVKVWSTPFTGLSAARARIITG